MEGEIRIADFGVARAVVREKDERGVEFSLTVTGQHVGTPHFMSPEQIDGTPDPRGDLYSFGALLYAMTAGRPCLGLLEWDETHFTPDALRDGM